MVTSSLLLRWLLKAILCKSVCDPPIDGQNQVSSNCVWYHDGWVGLRDGAFEPTVIGQHVSQSYSFWHHPCQRKLSVFFAWFQTDLPRFSFCCCSGIFKGDRQWRRQKIRYDVRKDPCIPHINRFPLHKSLPWSRSNPLPCPIPWYQPPSTARASIRERYARPSGQ